MFASEHAGYLPTPGANDGPNHTGNSGPIWPYRYPMWDWTYVVLPYANGNKDLFRCPSDESGLVFNVWNDDMTNLPDDPTADNIPGSYRLNASNCADYATSVNLSKLKNLSQSILVVEGTRGWRNMGSNSVATWGSAPEVVGWPPAARINVAWDRHRGRSNYAFADGHAENLAWDDTWRPLGPPVYVFSNHTMWRQLFTIQWPDMWPVRTP